MSAAALPVVGQSSRLDDAYDRVNVVPSRPVARGPGSGLVPCNIGPQHAKSWGASKFLNAKLRAFGKETALWGSWFGG